MHFVHFFPQPTSKNLKKRATEDGVIQVESGDQLKKDVAAELDQLPQLKLKLLCETGGLNATQHLMTLNIYMKLTTSKKNWDAKSVTEANGLLHAITSDSFIVSFQTSVYFFGYTMGLSVLLQGSLL